MPSENEQPILKVSFLSWFPELRRVVIDEMHPADRCRFSRCSRQCDKEVKKSKYAMYSLEIEKKCYNHFLIVVVPAEHKKYGETGYCLEIDGRFITYSKCSGGEVWRKRLWRQDVTRYATNHFRHLVQTYHRVLKRLRFFGGTFSERYNLDFKDFKKLEVLRVGSRLNLNFKQFQEIRASIIHVPIGQLTEHDLFEFFKSWQYEKVRGNLQYCEWNLNNSEFDARKFFNLFGERILYIDIGMILDLKRYQDSGMSVRLVSYGGWIRASFEKKSIV